MGQDEKKNYKWLKKYPSDIDWDADIPIKPVTAILEDTVKKFPQKTCINFYGKKISYAEIQQDVNRIAAGLQGLGIKKGDNVGILMPNCPQYIVAFYAILKTGATVVNLSPLYTISELKKQVEGAGIETLFTLNLTMLHEKTDNLLLTSPLEKVITAKIEKELPFIKKQLFKWLKKKELAVVNYGRINIEYGSLLKSKNVFESIKIEPNEDVAVLQYTGGTTGIPKAAMLTHSNIYANTYQTGLWFTGLEEGAEKMIGALPFFHVFAMTVVMNLAILKACEIVAFLKFDLLKIVKAIQSEKATLMPGVPTMFNAINHYEKIHKIKLSSLKFCISGGAPLPLETKKQFEKLAKCTLIEGYGLTESSPVATANPLFGKNKDGSIGLPLPKTTIEIKTFEGEKGKKCKTGEIGEICIGGPQVMKGYYNHEEETKHTLNKQFLHTGDLGYMDSEGYIFIADRLKDMIISGGFNIYPKEVEEVLYAHQAVEEACVIGVEDLHKGQVVKAFVKLKKDKSITEDALKAHCCKYLTKYKVPKKIVFEESLPKTMIGKISRKEIVEKDKKREEEVV